MKPALMLRIGIGVAVGVGLGITGWVVTKPETVSVQDRLMAGYHIVICIPELDPDYIMGCARREHYGYLWLKRFRGR